MPGYPVADSVNAAWDIEAIRAEHLNFIGTWADPSAVGASTALSMRTTLVADWLALLRVDPRLPREFTDEQWPANRSLDTYRRVHHTVVADSDAEFRALLAERPIPARAAGPHSAARRGRAAR
nr:PaaX family transcriptional regulator C-terminal domain-containing protein [Catellatospora sp. IY07-71]